MAAVPLFRAPSSDTVSPFVPTAVHATAAPLHVNGERLNRWLAAFDTIGRTATGINRVAYSPADLQGRAFTLDLFRQAGLVSHIDAAGNMYGRVAGTDAALKPILIGSHVDSVTDGGNYDGPVGTFSAIEVARTLTEQRVRLRHPVDVVCWQNEEGGTIGSKLAIDDLTDEDLDTDVDRFAAHLVRGAASVRLVLVASWAVPPAGLDEIVLGPQLSAPEAARRILTESGLSARLPAGLGRRQPRNPAAHHSLTARMPRWGTCRRHRSQAQYG